jgi:acetyl esterase/lipase
LATRLLNALLSGTYKWVFMLLRLMTFVVFLMPGFMVFLYYYLTYPIRGIPYGPSSRNLLDVYPIAANAPSPGKGGQQQGAPVIVFLTGGAWIIGYKMWGALMGRALAPNGVLLIIPDYRNFPQTDVKGMLTDVDMAVAWVRSNASEYGGDPNEITLVGQSAGAHLGALVLLLKAAASKRSSDFKVANEFEFRDIQDGVDFDLSVEAAAGQSPMKEITAITSAGGGGVATRGAAKRAAIGSAPGSPSGARLSASEIRDARYIAETPKRKMKKNTNRKNNTANEEESLSEEEEEDAEEEEYADEDTATKPAKWSPTDLRGFVCISGPYDLTAMVDHFADRGLDPKILNWIFQSSLSQYSPTIVAKNLIESGTSLRNHFPNTCVIHGSTDISVPLHIGTSFCEALEGLDVDSSMLVYEGWTHTDPILERPMAGDHKLHRDLYDLVRKWRGPGNPKMADFEESNPLCKRIMWPQVSIEIARFANPF